MDAGALRARIAMPVVVLLAVAVLWLLPDPFATPAADLGFGTVDAVAGVVVEIDPSDIDPVDPSAELEGGLLVRLTEGERAGEVVRAFVALPTISSTAEDFTPGDEVIVSFTDQPGADPFVAVAERSRLPVLAVLVALFAIAIVAVAGWQGLRALISLTFTIVVVVKLLIPAILAGLSPVLVAVAIAGLVTVVTILLTEGADRTSLAAIFGTLAGLAVVAVVSVLVGVAAGISGTGVGDLFFLELPSGDALDARGVLLAAVIIGSVGVLDDMTVSQAATVRQLGERPGLHGMALASRALRVGRSHIAATVNTLFLAYVGVSLPILAFLVVIAEPAMLTLNREVFAMELIRTLAGGLGIVLAMPLTTAIAVTLLHPASRARPPSAGGAAS